MESQETLDNVIAEYLIRRDEGESPDTDALIEAHPELAEDLRGFFDQEAKVVKKIGSAFSISPNAEFGPFKILRELGRGSWGVVYLAKRSDADEPFALKVLAGVLLLRERERTRFRNEVELLGQLDHPNIVGILEAGWVGDTPYYCMPLLSGHCGDLIESSRQRSDSSSIEQNPRQVAKLVQKVAQGLSHAHREGIVHRDVKPSNILLTEEQEPQLADFGLARTEGSASMTMSGEFIGTLRYTSPEQLLGERDRIDGRSDIYSLGVTMWELLTLQPLVAGEARNRIVHGVLNADVNSLGKLNSLIPHDLETITIRCLQKEPADRYQTAAELADDLGRFARMEKILASRPSTADRIWAWTQSNRNSAAAILLCLALVFLASLVSTAFVLRAQSATKSALATSVENERIAREAQELAKASELQALQLFYAAEMEQAYNAHIAGNAKQTRVHLSQVAEVDPERRLRGLEWDFLWQKCSHNARLLCEASSEIYAVTPSPDGQQLLIAGRDSNLQFFDVETGELKHELPTDQNEINDVIFSPDGERIATAGDDGTVKVWNAATRELVSSTKSGEHVVWTAAFLSGGRIAASCDNGSLRQRHKDGPFRQFEVFSSDGTMLATCGCGGRHGMSICRAALKLEALPDGDVIGGRDAIHRWTQKDGELTIADEFVKGIVYDLEIDHSRNLLFIASKGELKICDLSTFETVLSIPQPNSVLQVALFRERGYVAISVRGGQVILYGLEESDGKLERLKRVDAWAVDGDECHVLMPSKDEQRLLFTRDNRLYETPLSEESDSNRMVDAVYVGDHYSSAFLAYGKKGQIVDTDIASAVPTACMADYALTAHGGIVAGVSRHAQSRTVNLWDIKSGDLLYNSAPPDSTLDRIEISRDGNYVVLYQTSRGDGRVGLSAVLDWKSDKYTFVDESGLSRWNACFDHDNRVVLAPRDRLLCRDAQTGEVLWRDDQTRIKKYAIHPQRNLLAVGTSSHWIQFRDSSTGEIVRRIPTEGTVCSLAFTSDGKRLGYNHTKSNDFFLLDVSTGRKVATVPNVIRDLTNYPATFINDDTVFAVRSENTPRSTLLDLGAPVIESP